MGKVVNLDEIRRNKVIARVLEQQEKGLEKYGKTVDPDDYSISGWLEHLQQELVDGHVYSEVLREKFERIQRLAADAYLYLHQYLSTSDDVVLDLVHTRLYDLLNELDPMGEHE